MRVEQQNANIIDTLQQSIGPEERVGTISAQQLYTNNGISFESKRVEKAGNMKSVNLKDATYLKPEQDAQKSTAENMEQSSALDAASRKEQMVVLANTTSEEDYARMQEEGFSLDETTSNTIVTETDKIKAQLAKAGIAVNEIMVYENQELALSLGIKQAPTLVAVSGGQIEKFSGVPEIKKFIDELHNSNDEKMSEELIAALEDLKAKRAEVVTLVTAGKHDEALELFNGEYTQATDRIQDILIEIGNHSDESAVSAYKTARTLGTLAVVVMIIVGIGSIVLCLTFSKVITGLLVEPVLELQRAAQKLRNGELDIEIKYEELTAELMILCLLGQIKQDSSSWFSRNKV